MTTLPLDAWRREVNASLKQRLANLPEGHLLDAMDYALLGGGKRLRPLLCLATCLDAGGLQEDALDAACAVEMIHCYSLIHDDLPCMDDDDERRGKPSLHRAFDEATALLAGDALQSLAFATLAASESGDAETRVSMLRELAEASGACGMAGGQMLDLRAPLARTNDLSDLKAMQDKKTGALFRCALRLGLLSARRERVTLDGFAANLGLAFQLADDLRDRLGTREILGKQPGSDEKRGKLTWPDLVGIDEARRALQSFREACEEQLRAVDFEPARLSRLTSIALSTDDLVAVG